MCMHKGRLTSESCCLLLMSTAYNQDMVIENLTSASQEGFFVNLLSMFLVVPSCQSVDH